MQPALPHISLMCKDECPSTCYFMKNNATVIRVDPEVVPAEVKPNYGVRPCNHSLY